MTFRCEICDDWLPMFQFSKLCPTCYKIRTITKCYSAKEILTTLENNFLVSPAMEHEKRQEDVKFYEKEEERLATEALKEFNPTDEQLKQLEIHAQEMLEAKEKSKKVLKGDWNNAPLEEEYPKFFGLNDRKIDIMPPLMENDDDTSIPLNRKCKSKHKSK